MAQKRHYPLSPELKRAEPAWSLSLWASASVAVNRRGWERGDSRPGSRGVRKEDFDGKGRSGKGEGRGVKVGAKSAGCKETLAAIKFPAY